MNSLRDALDVISYLVKLGLEHSYLSSTPATPLLFAWGLDFGRHASRTATRGMSQMLGEAWPSPRLGTEMGPKGDI